MNETKKPLKVVALAGGVGGAKLAVGLQEALAPGALTVIVNTGDDFEHWGLSISPDLDTVTYNLAGINHPDNGWGRINESYRTLETMSQLGGEDWFRLGDCDLALHLRRTEWLRQGITLTEVTDRLRRSLGIPSPIVPMSDRPVRTLVHTDEGDLPFQHYFVRLRCAPILIDLTFVGADEAKLPEPAQAALHAAHVIVLCPSNPYLSIDPILSIPGLRHFLRQTKIPVIAVSPIVSGQAVKGPAAKIMKELGVLISPHTVVDRYEDFLTGFVIDNADRDWCESIQIPTLLTDTIMRDLASKRRLAEQVLTFAQQLSEVAQKA
ncbi:MAG TPA: 2-phospho-L-lactate transferase [Caldilineaceae bacterium]|nr:2-phospho-L-lactate transferase [Caldilineaceae bacterium]